jgi:predicted small lipoprotein YifL
MRPSKVIRLVGATAALAGAFGCGLKGPLYLPEHNGAVVTRPAGAAPGTGGTQQPATQQPAQTPQTDATPPPATNTPPATSPPATNPPPATPSGTTKKDPNKDDDSNGSPSK